MFLRQITEAFLVRTEPDSSMVKPAHIHIKTWLNLYPDRACAWAVSASNTRPPSAANTPAVSGR